MLLTSLALAVPLPALAISESDSVAQPGPAAISVSAALDSCGVLDGGIVCKINVAYSQIPGATSYSATVTAANGSVTDYGTVGANATTLYVPTPATAATAFAYLPTGRPSTRPRTATTRAK